MMALSPPAGGGVRAMPGESATFAAMRYQATVDQDAGPVES